MNLSYADYKKGTVKLRVTDPEDLWYLSHLIEAGDLVTGTTTRKMKLGTDENAPTVKKTFTATIAAEMIELAGAGNSLRVNGRIKAGPEEVPKDSYQALEVGVGSECTLTKKHWESYQKQKLREAAEKKYTYLLCVFDREEALIALTKHQGYKILLQLAGEVPQKGNLREVKSDFQQEIIKVLEQYAERYQPEQVILASPAFYKEDAFKKIHNPALKKKIVLASCSEVSERGLDEVMRQPELERTLHASKARKEIMMVDELLQEIQQEGAAAYGWKEVHHAVETGAVRVLLLTQEYIQQRRADGNYAELDELMAAVDAAQGEIHILSVRDEAGKKIAGLGSIAALLRYKTWG